MTKKSKTILIALLISTIHGYSQDALTENFTSYYIETFGSASTNGQTPFWMVSNRQDVVPIKNNNGYLQADITNHQRIGEKMHWVTGLNIVYSTPRYRHAYIQQLYTEVAYDWLHLSIGSNNNYGIYNHSLANTYLSSGHLARSLNARPIPEINFFIPNFVTIPKTKEWLQVKGHFAVGRSFDSDYIESFINNQEEYIQNTLWHHKSLIFRIKDTRNNFPLSATLGIHHTAQWGGTSTNPRLGEQPQTFKDFIRIVLGKPGGEGASQSAIINVLGAHYGVYDFGLRFEEKDWSISTYYQHLFNDGSGMEFRNKLDGLKGIQVNLNKTPWLQTIVVEHLSTLHQSGPFHFIEFDHQKYSGSGGGADDYYNNGEYTTGASYFNRSLGSPLLLSPEYNANGELGFRHNRIRAWHLGAEGNVSNRITYRILLSNMESYGTAYKPTLKKLTSTSFTTDLHYHLRDSWKFSASIAADMGELLGDHVGFSLSVTKQGLLRK